MNTIDSMKRALDLLNVLTIQTPRGCSVKDELSRAIEREEAQTGEPVAIVTCHGVMGVDFTEQCNYGCDLAVGTALFTRPAPPTSGERADLISRLRAMAKDSIGDAAADMLAADAYEIDIFEAQLKLDYKEIKRLMIYAQQVAVPQGLKQGVDYEAMYERGFQACDCPVCGFDGAIVFSPQPSAGGLNPLWIATHPDKLMPQAERASMTPDEIFRMYGALPKSDDVVIAIVRATEKHHGIGEKP